MWKQCRVAKIVIITALKKKKNSRCKHFLFMKACSRPRLTDTAAILTRAQREEISREEKLRMMVCIHFLIIQKSSQRKIIPNTVRLLGKWCAFCHLVGLQVTSIVLISHDYLYFTMYFGLLIFNNLYNCYTVVHLEHTSKQRQAKMLYVKYYIFSIKYHRYIHSVICNVNHTSTALVDFLQ